MLARWRTLRGLFPMTWQGFLLFSLSAFLGFEYGVQQNDWILLIVGGFGVSLSILDVLYVGVLGLWLRHRVQTLNEGQVHDFVQIQRGESIQTGFQLPRTTWPFADFSVRWEGMDCSLSIVKGTAGRTEEVTFLHRQVVASIQRKFEFTDLFGLASVSWEMEEKRDFEVVPRAHFHTPPMFQSRIDGEGSFVPNRPRHGDLVDTRAYMPGDPVRHIHWKLFARTGKPVVRVAEPSAREEKRLLIYLICGPDDEYAAELTLGALQSGEMGGVWQLGVDGVDRFASTLKEARRLLALSGNTRTHDPAGLERFLEQVGFSAEEHRLLLFAPGHIELWMSGLSGILEHVSPYSSLVVSCETSILPTVRKEQQRSARERWFLLADSTLEKPPKAEPKLLETLTHLGMQLTILERVQRRS